MIRNVCGHGLGFRPENSIRTATECFVGPNEVVDGHADGKLGFEPERLSLLRSVSCGSNWYIKHMSAMFAGSQDHSVNRVFVKLQ